MDNTQYQAENNVAPSDGEVGKLFRSAMRGFHKQDVTNYIERLARDRRRDAERYSAHIRSLEEERAQMTQELSHLRTQTAELNNEAFVLRNSQETHEAELQSLRDENAQLAEQNAALSAELDALRAKAEEQAAVPAADPGELTAARDQLAAAQEKLAAQEQEISRLKATVDALNAEKAELRREADAARRRPTTGGSADLMNRVRNKPAAQSEVADYRRRIERARQSAQEGIVESNSLYQEMRRNIARLEEILQSLND